MKDDCRHLIKQLSLYSTSSLRKFCYMVCTIRVKHSHFYVSQAQSTLCAVMQLMTAMGHRHVCPTPTNTQYPPSKPASQVQSYPLSPVTKRWFSCQQNKPLEEDVSYHLGSLPVTVCALVPISRGTPF